jgi:hypothetical protein
VALGFTQVAGRSAPFAGAGDPGRSKPSAARAAFGICSSAMMKYSSRVTTTAAIFSRIFMVFLVTVDVGTRSFCACITAKTIRLMD